MTDEPDTSASEVDDEAEAVDASASEPAAPPLPVDAEPTRDFGPDQVGLQSTDVEAQAEGGQVTVDVGVFAGSVRGVSIVKGEGDNETETEADEYTVTAVDGAVGVASLVVRSKGLTGTVRLRVFVEG